MSILVKHQLTFGTGEAAFDFFFLAPKGHYTSDMQTACGVIELEEDSDLQDMPVTKTAELTGSPVAARKTLRVKPPTGKKKYVDIVVAASKVAGLDEALAKKEHRLGVIERVLDPRKATRY